MRVNVYDDDGEERFLNLLTEKYDVPTGFTIATAAELAMHSLSVKMQAELDTKFKGE